MALAVHEIILTDTSQEPEPASLSENDALATNLGDEEISSPDAKLVVTSQDVETAQPLREEPSPSNPPVSSAPRGMFTDVDGFKERMRQKMHRETYDVTTKYKNKGIFQKIARHHFFENTTLAVIGLNAIWIAVDTDKNDADVLIRAPVIFQVADHFFCAYFSIELFVRYKAFAKKVDGLKDAWFVFDSFMVFIMVMETWVMSTVLLATGSADGNSGANPLGNATTLKLLRLMRLSRMARMARLLRSMPELVILIKGMAQAMRSVFFTLLLLFLVIYMFAIGLVQLTEGSTSGDQYFKTVPQAMSVLLLAGTFLDGLGMVARSLEADSLWILFVFYLFVLLAPLTVMNMLIGVLCEVVTKLASTEKDSNTLAFVFERLQQIIEGHGLSETVSKDEFLAILGDADAIQLLHSIGVYTLCLVDMVDEIFASPTSQGLEDGDQSVNLSIPDFMEVVFQLRGTNNATTKDVVDLRKCVRQLLKRFELALEPFLHPAQPSDTQTPVASTPETPPPTGYYLGRMGSNTSGSTCIDSHIGSNCGTHESEHRAMSKELEARSRVRESSDAGVKVQSITHFWTQAGRLEGVLAAGQSELQRFFESLPPEYFNADGSLACSEKMEAQEMQALTKQMMWLGEELSSTMVALHKVRGTCCCDVKSLALH